MTKVIPNIPKIKAHFVHRAMDIPDFLEVPMSDGRIVRYVPEVEHPSLRKIRENMKNMKGMCVGYPPDGGAHSQGK